MVEEISFNSVITNFAIRETVDVSIRELSAVTEAIDRGSRLRADSPRMVHLLRKGRLLNLPRLDDKGGENKEWDGSLPCQINLLYLNKQIK